MMRLDSSLLIGVGVLAVHQTAYSASSLLGAESAVGHGHLAAAWLLGGLAAVFGLARSITRSLRTRRYTPPTLSTSSIAVGLGYVGMESIERLLDGASVVGLAGEAVFWLGLVAAPAVAAALRSMARSVHDLAERIVVAPTRTEHRRPALTGFASTSVDLAPLVLRSNTVSRRGPPVRLFP